MWMTLSRKDTRTDHERYLEDELDSLREQQRLDAERREREQEQRKLARREEHEYEMRQAVDWPDALRKQESLCRREVNDGGDEEIGNFFGNTVAACERAQEIWREVESSRRAEIEQLENKIAAIRDSIRVEVASKLEAADPRREFAQIATQMRDDQLAGFLDW